MRGLMCDGSLGRSCHTDAAGGAYEALFIAIAGRAAFDVVAGNGGRVSFRSFGCVGCCDARVGLLVFLRLSAAVAAGGEQASVVFSGGRSENRTAFPADSRDMFRRRRNCSFFKASCSALHRIE